MLPYQRDALWGSLAYVSICTALFLFGAAGFHFLGPWGVSPAVFLSTWLACYVVSS